MLQSQDSAEENARQTATLSLCKAACCLGWLHSVNVRGWVDRILIGLASCTRLIEAFMQNGHSHGHHIFHNKVARMGFLWDIGGAVGILSESHWMSVCLRQGGTWIHSSSSTSNATTEIYGYMTVCHYVFVIRCKSNLLPYVNDLATIDDNLFGYTLSLQEQRWQYSTQTLMVKYNAAKYSYAFRFSYMGCWPELQPGNHILSALSSLAYTDVNVNTFHNGSWSVQT